MSRHTMIRSSGQFRVLQIPAFTIPGFTDSGFYNSGFYRFRLLQFRVLQIPAFTIPGFCIPHCIPHSIPHSIPRFLIPGFTDSHLGKSILECYLSVFIEFRRYNLKFLLISLFSCIKCCNNNI